MKLGIVPISHPFLVRRNLKIRGGQTIQKRDEALQPGIVNMHRALGVPPDNTEPVVVPARGRCQQLNLSCGKPHRGRSFPKLEPGWLNEFVKVIRSAPPRHENEML